MRKKPTFEELANATLEKSTITPLRMPYCPYKSSSQALVDLQAMTQQIQAQQQRSEDVQTATRQEARDLGVDPRVIEQVAHGVLTRDSPMFQEMLAQQQNARAADQRMNELRHESMSRQLAQTHDAIARNADVQLQVAATLQTAPDQMAAAVASQIAQMPRAIPDDILQMMRQRMGSQFTMEQFQAAWNRFTGEQRQLAQETMQNLMQGQQQGQRALLTQQQQGQQALMNAQDQNMQQTLNRLQQLQDARSTALVSQDQSQDAARHLLTRLIENLIEMFREAARGHQAISRQMLEQAAAVFRQFPNVSIQNIDARQLIPQLVQLTNVDARSVTAPAIERVMNTLSVPVTPEAIQNVAQQLAISDVQAKLSAPPLPPPTKAPPPSKAASTALAIEDTQRTKPRESIKEQGKRKKPDTQAQMKAKSVVAAAARINAARNQPLPLPDQAASSSNVEIISGPSTSHAIGPLDVHSKQPTDRALAVSKYGDPKPKSVVSGPPRRRSRSKGKNQ